MFEDGKIIKERGMIFKWANVVAIIVSLVFLVCRIFIYNNRGLDVNFLIYSTEIFTILAAEIILLYGEVAFRGATSDERVSFKKYHYYALNGKYLLIAILCGYAVSRILDTRISEDLPTNYILFIFELVGVIFF